MKSSKNFLKFFCFILILTYIQSKYYNSKKILLQTKRAVAASNIINQSCYLKSKEKTEASGCFFDTAENLLNIIEKKIEIFSEKCDLNSKDDVRRLYDIADSLGALSGKLYRDPSFKPSGKDLEILEKSDFSIHFIVNSTIQFQDIENAFSNTLKEEWLSYTRKKSYPQFYIDNALDLAAYAYAKSFLLKGYSNKKQCIDVNSLNRDILFIVSKDINIEETPLINKEISNIIKLPKKGFEYGGYALAFWVKQDTQDLIEAKKLISAFVNNTEALSLQIKKCQINNVLTIGDKNYNIHITPKCAEYSFVLLVFFKDCDAYRVKYIMRSSFSNERYNITTEDLDINLIENLQIKIDSDNVISPQFYTHFKYSESKENQIFVDTYKNIYSIIENSVEKCSTSDEKCRYATNEGKCIVCKEGYLLNEEKCVKNCPNNAYQIDDYSCIPCSNNCQKCEDSNSCLTCKEGFNFYDGKCLEVCVNGTFPVNGECKNCEENCQSCLDENKCGKCAPGTYEYNGKCYKECPKGSYLDLVEFKCSECKLGCSECNSYEVCSDCDDDYYLFDEKKCNKECPNGYRKNTITKICEPCLENCKYCDDDKNSCQVCNEGFSLKDDNTCEGCKRGQVSFKGICIDCEDEKNCVLCSSYNTKKCEKCDEEKVLLPNATCGDKCDEGFYLSDDRVCTSCVVENCKSCSKTQCNYCNNGYVLFNFTKCVTECPDGYINIDGICTPCNNNLCKKCSEDLSTCSTCYAPDYILKEGECVTECGEKYFQSGNVCKPCEEGCKECINEYTCNTCIEKYYNKEGKCVTDCGDGQRENKITGKCETCKVSNCKYCSKEADICSECGDGKVLYNNECYDFCPIGSYLPINTGKKVDKCKSCPLNCQKCSDDDTCLACNQNYVLQDNVCQIKCNDFYYNENGICKPCENSNCLKCSGQDSEKCESCPSNRLFYNNECLTECPDGTFEKEGKCLICDPTCKTCSGSSNNCLTCVKGLEYHQNEEEKCVTDCDLGSVPVDGVCKACTQKDCEICKIDNLDYCLQPKYPNPVHNGTVFDHCPEGTFLESEGQCKSCKTNCRSCQNSNGCFECNEGFYLKDNECVSQCGNGYVNDESNKKCHECSPSCLQCKLDDNECCTVCPVSQFLLNCECFDTCPEKYWSDYENKLCKTCEDLNCKICSNKGKTCDKCSNGYVLNSEGTKCIPAPCPDGTLLVNGQCKSCLVNNCTNCPIITSICATCEKGKILINEYKCSDTCPEGQYKELIEGKEGFYYCENCLENCLLCNNGQTCKTCIKGKVLYNNTCIDTCPYGYFANEDGRCEECGFGHCKRCSKDNCFECNRSYKLLESENTCYEDCPKGYYEDDNDICQECGLNCEKCTNAKKCKQCNKPFVLGTDGVCTDECEKGTVNINGQCKTCLTGELCSKCDVDLITCNACIGDYVLQDGECNHECKDGYYNQDGICKPCINHCYRCSNSKQCDECSNGWVLFDDKCVDICPDGYIKGDKKCIPCPAGCNICTNADTCTSCEEGKKLEENRCVNQCSIGYYESSTIECKPCDENCVNCQGTKNCQACANGYTVLNGECVSKCPSNMLSVNGVCKSCTDKCKVCGENIDTCSECEENFYLNEGKCINPCPEGFSNRDGRCESCPEFCKLCSFNFRKEDVELFIQLSGNGEGNSLSGCDECENGYSYHNETKSCVEKCPLGYSSFNGKCKACTGNNCKACDVDTAICSECPINFYLYQGICVEECPKGTYISDKLCLPCAIDCESCKDGEICSTCHEGTYLNDGRCTNECDKNEVVVNGECIPCKSEHCSVCNPSQLNECKACEDNYYLLDNKCVSDCGENYFNDVNSRNCLPCNNGACKLCENGDICNTCYEGYVNQNGVCKEKCDEKYVENNGECIKCSDENCLICNNVKLDTCKKCNLPYKLFEDKCVMNCDQGYYIADFVNYQVCEKCPENCLSCNSKNSCNNCVCPFVLLNNQCVSTCPEGYVNVNGICKSCSQTGCLQCSESDQSICSKCENGLYLANNQCTSNCGTGFYPSPEGKCIQCGDINCKECSPSNICKTCYEGKVILDGKCFDSCPSGYYGKQFECYPCEDKENCKSCDILNPEKCQECSNGFLFEDKCIEMCPEGYYPDESRKCIQCPGGCSSCKNSKYCYTCESGLFLDENDHTCKDNCQSGQVAKDGKCDNCEDKNCIECSVYELSWCYKCYPPFYNYNRKCVSECPDGTYASSPYCFDCSYTCTKCTSYSICQECRDGYVKQDDYCIDECYKGYVNIDGICTKCNLSHCNHCSDLNFCLECNDKYLNDNGKCVETCGPGKYYNETEKKCSNCLPGCATCDNGNSCSLCEKGLFLYKKKECFTSCPDGYFDYDGGYFFQVTPTCVRCYEKTCKTCEWINPDICTSCAEGQLLITYEDGSTKCLNTCPSNYIPNTETGTCEKCEFPCKECAENPNYCITCENPYKLIANTCVSNCPENTAEREGICYNCVDEHCLACDSYELSKCNVCDDETILFNGECLKECPEHYYLKITENGAKTCEKCSINCDKCTDSENCVSCLNNYYFEEGTKFCVPCENPNLIIGNECVQCKVEGCNVCAKDQPEVCSICNDKLSLYNGKCYTECPNGLFKNGNTCDTCESNCLSCTGKDQCNECDENHVIYNGMCIEECPEGFRNNDGRCDRCSDENCLYCPTSPLVCESCKTLTYENKCYDTCPEGTFIYGNTCNVCQKNCLKCDSTQCFSCPKGSYIFEDKCVENCGDGYYVKDDRICISCSQNNCKACNEDNCIEPKDGFYLDDSDDEGVSECKEGKFGNEETKRCESCGEGCSLCTSKENCLTCFEGYSFFNDICVKPCPEKFTSVNGRCVPCIQEKCLTCAPHDPQTCISCPDYLYNGVCVDNCPEGTFVDNNNRCVPCDSKCKSCKDENKCIKCKPEFILDGNNCLSKCEDGKVSISGECFGCEDEKCKVCSNNLKECLECFPPNISYKGQCVDKCPIGTYEDAKKNICSDCDFSCDDCLDKETCLQCKKGYYMLNGKCLLNCPDGYYEDCATTSRKCEKCNSACKTCVLEKASDCIECADGYFLYKKECISTCPLGTYFDIGNNTCIKCKTNYCAECTPLNQCKRCNRGYNLENNECVTGTTITNIIGDYMLISESYDKLKSQRPPQQMLFKDYKGTGIGANDVTLSFYLRSLTPVLKKDMEVIDVVNDKSSGYSFKFIIDKDDNKCKLKIYDYGTDKVYNTKEICDCKYKELYNWKFFAISLGRDREDFVARITTLDEEDNKIIEETVKLDNNNHFSVLEPSAYIVLSPNNGTNYHIGKLNVMDYYPTDDQLKDISRYLPAECDYFCSNCQDNCKSCSNGLLPTHNRCKANYIKEDPYLNTKQELYEVSLNKKLKGNLVSDAYGYTQWFFVENINTKEENILSVDVNDFDYIRLTIKEGKLYFNGKELNFPKINEGSWYFLLISLLKDNVTVMIQEEHEKRYVEQIDDFTFIRHYNDFIYSLHDNDAKSIRSSYNSKIYINNNPNEEDIETKVTCPENCLKCDDTLICNECADGFRISKGICKEISAKEDNFIELVNIKDYWNKDMDVFDVPYDENLTITFNLRKKIHSNFYADNNIFNIIGIKKDSSDNVISLLKEDITADFQSTYKVFNDENNFVHNYTEEIPDFLQFIYMINIYDNSVSTIVNDFSTKQQYTFNFNLNEGDKIKHIVVGDENGAEMNYEVTNLKVYDGIARGELLEKLKEYPKACSGICTDCDYSVGLCNICSYEKIKSTPHECRSKFYEWYPASLFNVFDWNLLKTGEYIMYLNNFEKVGINSEVSSFYFRFKMFKLIEGSKYRIACFSNDKTKIFNPTENRGNNYLCIDVNVKNNEAYLDLLINDGQKVTISVPNFTFKKGELVRGAAVVNANEKVFKYTIKKIGNEDVTREYNYKHIPERLQESGGISLYGVEDEDVDKNVYSIPHIFIDKIGVVPNFNDYMSLFDKFESKLPLNKQTCNEECDACVWNSKAKKAMCYECLPGFIPITNKDDSVSCERLNYKINLFKGNLIQGNQELLITDKSIFEGGFSLYFQLIFNFAFHEYNVSNTILELGKINIVAVNNKLYAVIKENSVEIPIIDIYKKWNNILLVFEGDTLKITVTAESKTNTATLQGIDINQIKAELNSASQNLIKIYSLGYSTTFGAVAVSDILDINQVRQEDPTGYDECGPNCAYCENGKCKVCGAGNNNKNDEDCDGGKKQFVNEYYRSADNTGLYTHKDIFTPANHARFIRMKKWTFETTLDFEEMPLYDEVTFLKFLNFNGIDSIICNIIPKERVIYIYLYPSETIHTGKEPDKVTLKLPNSMSNFYFFFAMSYEDNQFKAIFAEKVNNYVTAEYTMSAFLGTFGPESTFEFYNKGKKNTGLTISHTTFFYNYAKSIKELEKNLKKSRKIQNDCMFGTINKCTNCYTGNQLNGICRPRGGTYSYDEFISKFEIFNKYKNDIPYPITLGNFKGFSLFFTYKILNLLDNTLNFIQVKLANNYNLITIQYSPTNSKFIIKLGTHEFYTGRVFGFDNIKNLFDYYHVAVSYKLSLGELVFVIKNMENEIILYKEILYSEAKKIEIKNRPGLYLRYGFKDGSTLTGSFEFGSLQFLDYAADVNKTDTIFYNGLFDNKIGCKKFESFACTKPLTEKETDFTSRVYDIASNTDPLFFKLITSSVDKYYSFSKYVISFELDVNYFYSDSYTANPNYLFVFTDYYNSSNDDILSYKKTSSLTDYDFIIKKSLSLYLSGTSFTIKTPTLPWTNFNQPSFDINFGTNKFTENIIVSLYGDAENDKLSMVLTYKSTSYFYDIELNLQKIPLIGFATLVYGHPALKNFNINFNSVDLDNNFYDNFANNVTVSCVSANGKNYCPDCSAKFKLFQAGCHTTRMESLY